MSLFKRCASCQRRFFAFNIGHCRECGQPLCWECDGSWRGGYSPGFGLCETCKETLSQQAEEFVRQGGLRNIRSSVWYPQKEQGKCLLRDPDEAYIKSVTSASDGAIWTEVSMIWRTPGQYPGYIQGSKRICTVEALTDDSPEAWEVRDQQFNEWIEHTGSMGPDALLYYAIHEKEQP